MQAAETDALLVVGLLLLGSLLGARTARMLGLPAMTGHLAAGLGVGIAAGPLVGASTPLLATVKQGAAVLILFWIGSKLTLAGPGRVFRSASRLAAAAAVSVIFCAIALMVPLPSGFSAAAGTLGWTDVLLVALVLSATSPTVMAVVAHEDGRESGLARTGLDATVLANAGLLVLLLGTLALAADARNTSFALLRDLCAGLGIGAGIGVLVARAPRSVPSSVLIALAAVAFLVLRNELEHHETALMGGSFLAGAAMAHAGREGNPDRNLARLPEAVPVLSAVLFAVAGALVDVRSLAVMAVPAAMIVIVRGVSLYAGSRIAGALAGDASMSRLGFAPLLPQAGFSLAIVGALGPMGEPIVTLVLAVVLINEIATPPLLRLALRASDRRVAGAEAAA